MIRWDPEKSARLKRERGVSFEEIVLAEWLCLLKNPVRKHQRLLVFRHQGYVWVAPCVISNGEIFLKTMFPSRKYKRMLDRGELP
jgi:hypothetical protein